MASGLYGEVFYRMAKGTLAIDGLNVKMMLLNTSASFNAAHIWASQISGYEISCTNYGRGYGGAGRKAMTLSTTKAANGRSAIVHLPANITWASLGGTVNTTVGAAAIFVEGTSDANSLLVGFFDIDNTTTIGTDFTLVITDSPGGNITLGNS